MNRIELLAPIRPKAPPPWRELVAAAAAVRAATFGATIAPPEPRERRSPKHSVRRPPGGGRRPHTPTARLVIADNHVALRKTVRELLERDGMDVVGEAADGAHATRLVCALKPDVAILDVAMSELDGFEAARQIARRSPGTKVILLSAHSEARFVREALTAGAMGYVTKDRAVRELLQAIRRVLRGQIYLCTASMLEPVQLKRPDGDPDALLPLP